MLKIIETLNKEQERTKAINKLLINIETTSSRIFEIYKNYMNGYRVSKNSTIELIKYLANDVYQDYKELMNIADDVYFEIGEFNKTLDRYIEMIKEY